MDPFELVVSRMDGVQRHGDDSARAFSPLSGRKNSRSVSISRGANGTILIYDFAGASPHEILAAVGLELADLFPERIKGASPEARKAAHAAFRRNGWAAALAVLGREATVVEIAAADLADNKVLSEADHARLLLACSRVHGAREVLQ